MQALRTRIAARMPYPLVLQGLVALSLLAAPLAVLSGGLAALRPEAAHAFGIFTLLISLHLVLVLLVPVRRLPTWLQLGYLIGQCGLTAAAQFVLPAPTLSYIYLTIVLQALYLFRPWLWIPFAVAVWLVWSGALIVNTRNVLAWLQSNLVFAFPATCVLIAAILYVRQQRRHEQIQRLLAQVEQQYQALNQTFDTLQQRAAQEERDHVVQTVISDLRAALAGVEQSTASAIAQAQQNLSRLQSQIAQSRSAAGAAIERLRSAVATLRSIEPEPPAATLAHDAAGLPFGFGLRVGDGMLTSSLSTRVLAWVLPFVFLFVALPLAFIQAPASARPLALVAAGLLLVVCYLLTQWVRRTVLIQIGLIAQTAAVIAMAGFGQTLALLLGLLLVIWQIVLRLAPGQIAAFLIALLAALATALIWRPFAFDETGHPLVIAIAGIAVTGMLYMARVQFARRHSAEMQLVNLARLTHELALQANEVRTLAVAAERTRLAREFHDDLGSQLVLINLQLQMAEELIEEDPAAALSQLHATRQLLHRAWQNVFHATDAVLLIDGHSLAPALHDLVAQCRLSAGARISLYIAHPLDDLAPAVACTIYRAAQEGLTNACKHARAGEIALLLDCAAGEVNLSVCDDGLGKAEDAAAPGGGYGLRGLRERAEMLCGQVFAGPLPGRGFGLFVRLPIDVADTLDDHRMLEALSGERYG
jgi:signal transduction histidine kinase